jgi:hypothetical protein
MADQDEAEPSVSSGEEPAKRAKQLRVKVVDHNKEGRPAVNIRVPIGGSTQPSVVVGL